MTIKQLSIFLENRAGTLLQTLQIFKHSGIQLIASTIADTVDFGICRIICSDPDRAFTELRKAGVPVTLSDVFAVELDNHPGEAADALEVFSREDIEISYLYSFLLAGHGVLIFRTDNPSRAEEIISQQYLRAITGSQLLTMAQE